MELREVIDAANKELKTLKSGEFKANFTDESHVGTVQIGDLIMNCYCGNIEATIVGNKIIHRITLIEA